MLALILALTLTGRVVAVHDGDTLTIVDAARIERRIRLAGIDAPEKGQPFSAASKRNLSALAYGKHVSVVVTKLDPYDRVVGKVLIEQSDICLEQLRAGFAWFYSDYQSELTPTDRSSYSVAAREAKASRRGLWREIAAPPWQFRRERRQRSRDTQLHFTDSAVIGNRKSGIYHLPDCPSYSHVAERNRVRFATEVDALEAGYRRARNCP